VDRSPPAHRIDRAPAVAATPVRHAHISGRARKSAGDFHTFATLASEATSPVAQVAAPFHGRFAP